MKKLLLLIVVMLAGCSGYKYAPYGYVSVYESADQLQGFRDYIIIQHDPDIMTLCFPIIEKNVIGSWDLENDTLTFRPRMSIDRYNREVTIEDFSKIRANVLCAINKYLVHDDYLVNISSLEPTDSVEQKVDYEYYLVKYKEAHYSDFGIRKK